MKHNFEQISETVELDYCTKCGGLEGSLTTDCSGVSMTGEQSDAVYYGNLDYREGQGWVRGLSPMGENIVMSRLIDMEMGRPNAPKNENEIILLLGVPKDEFNRVKKRYVKYLLTKEV